MANLNATRMIEKLEEAAASLKAGDSGSAQEIADVVARTLEDYNRGLPCQHRAIAGCSGARPLLYCENCGVERMDAPQGPVEPDPDEHAAELERQGNEIAERAELEAEERHAGEDDDEAPTALRVVDLDRSSAGRDPGREDFHADS